jgi:hypothetical protein
MSDATRTPQQVRETPALPSQDDSRYYHGFNKRQRAAVDLRVPDSGRPWLDDMIRQSLRQEFAGQALAGLCQNWNENPMNTKSCADVAYDLADAMLERRKK